MRAKEGREEHSMFKVSRSGREEIPHVQGKRNPSKKVRCCKRASEGRHTETIKTEN